MDHIDYIIEKDINGFTAVLSSTAKFGSPDYLCYFGPTKGDRDKFEVKGFVNLFDIHHMCNVNIYFKSIQEIDKAIKKLSQENNYDNI